MTLPKRTRPHNPLFARATIDVASRSSKRCRPDFPFSDFAKQIQLELMFAYYKSGAQAQAIDAADTFMRENPTHESIDYALYIKALAYYETIPACWNAVSQGHEQSPPQGSRPRLFDPATAG